MYPGNLNEVIIISNNNLKILNFSGHHLSLDEDHFCHMANFEKNILTELAVL